MKPDNSHCFICQFETDDTLPLTVNFTFEVPISLAGIDNYSHTTIPTTLVYCKDREACIDRFQLLRERQEESLLS